MATKKRKGTAPAKKQARIPSETLLLMYRGMVRLRRIDERMLKLQRQGRIGFYGSASGQEAAVIGCAAALEASDWIFPALREGGMALFRGFPLHSYMCQNFGNNQDLLKGRQMPCHYSSRAVNFVSWSSCIGTQLPQAVGAAHAMKLKGDRSVVLAALGDGATSEGDFHVAMNFAGVFRVPVVFFCQNNQWAISVPVQSQTASRTIAEKARAYGFAGVRVDGNDVVAVHEAVSRAAERARSGKGPMLIEALTYRLGAHSSSDDPSRYRDESKTEEWREQRDPVKRCRMLLEDRGEWDQAHEDRLIGEIDAEMKQLLAETEAMPGPGLETLFDDVYASLPPHLREQKKRLLDGPRRDVD